jgi:hypothetical protein
LIELFVGDCAHSYGGDIWVDGNDHVDFVMNAGGITRQFWHITLIINASNTDSNSGLSSGIKIAGGITRQFWHITLIINASNTDSNSGLSSGIKIAFTRQTKYQEPKFRGRYF